jgi:hypothetical protein
MTEIEELRAAPPEGEAAARAAFEKWWTVDCKYPQLHMQGNGEYLNDRAEFAWRGFNRAAALLAATAKRAEDAERLSGAEVWAEVYRLRAEVQGPDGYATWKDAAIAERTALRLAREALTVLHDKWLKGDLTQADFIAATDNGEKS